MQMIPMMCSSGRNTEGAVLSVSEVDKTTSSQHKNRNTTAALRQEAITIRWGFDSSLFLLVLFRFGTQ